MANTVTSILRRRGTRRSVLGSGQFLKLHAAPPHRILLTFSSWMGFNIPSLCLDGSGYSGHDLAGLL